MSRRTEEPPAWMEEVASRHAQCPLHPEKAVFHDHEQATSAARQMRRSRGFLFRAYECPACGSYHLTTKQRRTG